MKLVSLFFSAAFLSSALAGPHLIAGELFFQTRIERSKCHVPNYDHRATISVVGTSRLQV